jgi:hypothetical protein
MGRESTSHMLQPAPDERRYPNRVAFFLRTVVDVIDAIIELFDR